MAKASHEFQVFAKPAGSFCNLGCLYCYYLEKEHLYPKGDTLRMPDAILEEYILQHIAASSEPVIRFSWHGGEPTVLGVDYFRKIAAFQRKHQPRGRHIANGIQTNGILLDEEWCRFLSDEGYIVGLSMDGPQEMHDRCRVTKNREPTHRRVMRGYGLLRKHEIPCDILCVVNSANVDSPAEVYRFFRRIGASYLAFLPMVEARSDTESGVSSLTLPAASWGKFLCTVFDEWLSHDIGSIKVQIFEEAARTAFGQAHSLCIFRPECGDIPVIEHNGDFFSCDHFVDPAHRIGNIREIPLIDMLESPAQRAFGRAKQEDLPRTCRTCEVLDLCNGGCPKNRFIRAPDGEKGLNYLCPGYKRFFVHCLPWIAEVAVEWRRQRAENQSPLQHSGLSRPGPGAGRNDPCPCGSGLKYKKCCLDR